jgi:hypothetical protein
MKCEDRGNAICPAQKLQEEGLYNDTAFAGRKGRLMYLPARRF